MRRRFREVREVKEVREVMGVWSIVDVSFRDTIMVLNMKYVTYGTMITTPVDVPIDMDVYDDKLTPYLKEKYLKDTIRETLMNRFGIGKYSSLVPDRIMKKISDHYLSISLDKNREAYARAEKFMHDFFMNLPDEIGEDETDDLPDEIDDLPEFAELD